MQVVRLRILGDLQLEGCDTTRLGRRQVRTLLKVLAVGHGRSVSVDRLVDCLWGDTPPARPEEQISVLASRLRRILGADRVLRNDGGYTLILDWLDLDALRDCLAEADRRLVLGSPAAARTVASAGLSLIRGPLLADERDAWWADSERATTDLVVSRLHQIVASAALADGGWAEAAHLAGQVLISDPFDESALRVSMEALARSGRQASALATYAAARKRLGDELGVSLSEETEALHSSIILGNLPAHRRAESHSASGLVELPGRILAMSSLDGLVERALRAGKAKSVWSKGKRASGSHGCCRSGQTALLAVASRSFRSHATSSVSRCPSNHCWMQWKHWFGEPGALGLWRSSVRMHLFWARSSVLTPSRPEVRNWRRSPTPVPDRHCCSPHSSVFCVDSRSDNPSCSSSTISTSPTPPPPPGSVRRFADWRTIG